MIRLGKNHIVFFLFLYASIVIAQERQIIVASDNTKQVVFVNGANVRNQPSLKAKVLDTLLHNQVIPYYSGKSWVKDSINGCIGYWKPMRIKGDIGYVWSGVLALTSFKTILDVQNPYTVLVQLSSENRLGFKVFNETELMYEKYITINDKIEVIASTTIGKTFNSHNNEIFVVLYSDNSYDLFEWDGITIFKSNIKLRDDSFITGVYTKYEGSIINSDRVNMRAEPSLESDIIANLPLYTKINSIEQKYRTDSINKTKGSWSKVKWNDKEGYIWGEFVSNPVKYVRSNNHDQVSFICTKGYIFVAKNDAIVSHIVNRRSYFDSFYSKGTLGFTNEYEFLAVRIVGYSCGSDSGELYYIWDGNKIKYFGSSIGVGDGALSWWKTFSFPKDHGVTNTVIEQEVDGEGLDFPPLKDGQDNYKFFIYNKVEKTLEYKNDTLFEVASKDLDLRTIIKSKFPKYSLKHYLFGDINQDGIDDALAFILKESDNYDSKPKNMKVVVLYGKTDNSFQIEYTNKDIVADYFSTVDLMINDGVISITNLYNVGYDSQSGITSKMSQFEFTYNKKDKALYWSSKIESEQLVQGRERKWETKKIYYKTNKISFDKAYNNKEFLYPDF